MIRDKTDRRAGVNLCQSASHRLCPALAIFKALKSELKDRDEPVTIPLDPEVALRALLAVEPEGGPPDNESGDGPKTEK